MSRVTPWFELNEIVQYKISALTQWYCSVYSVRLWMLGRHFHRVVPWFIVFVVLGSCAAAICMYKEPSSLSVSDHTSTALSYEVYTISDFFQLHDISCMFLNNPYNGAQILHTEHTYQFLVSPDTLIFAGISFIIPKLYINSLLAMFNARDTKEHSSSSSVARRTFKVHDEERIINTIPLSTIGQGMPTLDESIDGRSKLELQFHGSV
ncbi:hypothetical protein ARMSODRAFT_983742 [Armillaria solidipes]|uniref:DUF6534 domain-containing protein n=1 Tax=Armillaria solidipes TaxID=1076256 RepID=A0A2H3AP93_9AGAR|nr:hypothetical protein ARMSODRAFT_983742 [Armillaria solidipes]